MTRARKAMVLSLALLGLTGPGCALFSAKVHTGLPPSDHEIRQWSHRTFWGLSGPAELEITDECPSGVAVIVTETTIWNWLATAPTLGIYAPTTTGVVCAR